MLEGIFIHRRIGFVNLPITKLLAKVGHLISVLGTTTVLIPEKYHLTNSQSHYKEEC